MNKTVIAAITTVGGGGFLVVLALATKYWISVEVGAQMAAAGIVPESTVTAIDTRVGHLEDLHGNDIERVERKAEKIAEILMSD